MVYVPYKSGPEALRDLSEARIQAALIPLGPSLGPVGAGKVRLIAVTNPERSPSVPQVPTVAEAGCPKLSFEGVLGFLAPRSMPEDLRNRIAADIRSSASDPRVRRGLITAGQVAKGSTPVEYETFLNEQRQFWGELARSHLLSKRTD